MNNTPQGTPQDPNVPPQGGANSSGGMPPQQPNQGWQQDPNLPGWQQQSGQYPGQQPQGHQPYGQQHGQQAYGQQGQPQSGQQPGPQQYGQQPYGVDSAAPGYATSSAFSTQPPQTEKKGLGGAGIALIVGAVVLVLLVGMVGLGIAMYLNKQDPPAPTVAVPTPNTETSKATPAEPTQETTQQKTGSPDEVNKPPALPDWMEKSEWDKLPQAKPKTKADKVLMKSWLYDYYMPVPKGCPALKRSPNGAEYKETAQKLVDCLYESWAPLFAEADKKFSKPLVKFYKKDMKNPCLKSLKGLSVYYCELDATIYIPEAVVRIAGRDKLLPYADIFKVFIYHVQSRAGFFDAVVSPGKNDQETFRRLFLQSRCIQARQMILTDSMNMKRDQYTEFSRRLAGIKDPNQGSPLSSVYWGRRGFYAERVGDCNTWGVPSRAVK